MDGIHPIETGRYVIRTPQISALFDRICGWADSRIPGAIIGGRQRMGKTFALRFIRSALKEAYGGIFIANLLTKHYRNPTERAFFEDLLTDCGHCLVKNGSPNHKRDRYVSFLQQQADALGDGRVFLIVDDAQKLKEDHYEWLMDVSNALSELGLDLVVYLVGEPEIFFRRDSFRQQKKMQIVGRFMVESYQFTGLCNEEELTKTLSYYDDESEFPTGSNKSYVAHFFPLACRDGFRLDSIGPELWSAFDICKLEAKQGPLIQLPMQYFCLAVANILKECSTREAGAPRITKAEIARAVEDSGFGNSVRWGDFDDEFPPQGGGQ